MNLTDSHHQCVTGSVSLDASLNHLFRSSALMPDGPPALPLLTLHTSCANSSSPVILSSTSAGITSMGTQSPSGGLHLYKSARLVAMLSMCSCYGGACPPQRLTVPMRQALPHLLLLFQLHEVLDVFCQFYDLSLPVSLQSSL